MTVVVSQSIMDYVTAKITEETNNAAWEASQIVQHTSDAAYREGLVTGWTLILAELEAEEE